MEQGLWIRKELHQNFPAWFEGEEKSFVDSWDWDVVIDEIEELGCSEQETQNLPIVQSMQPQNQNTRSVLQNGCGPCHESSSSEGGCSSCGDSEKDNNFVQIAFLPSKD